MKLYTLLLKLYPARFREEYAAPLDRQFRDEYAETGGGAAFWARALRDLAVSIPLELARELFRDMRHSFRIYAKRPLATLLALAALAMAIGATTGVFSVLNALLFRSLPFDHPERIVELRSFPGGIYKSPAEFNQAWDHRYLEEAADYDPTAMNLMGSRETASVNVTETSASFFRLLGSDTLMGRSFEEGEDVPGKDRLAVLSYALWQQYFGGDPHALGATIRLNGAPVTVIGIARPGMDYPEKTAIWTPTTFDFDALPKTGATFWVLIGRLKAGAKLAAANSVYADTVARTMTGPTPPGSYPKAQLIPLRDVLAGDVGRASLVLMGAVAFVLLIACANIANLLLSRVAERKKEMALRSALGASRSRLVQQLITESVLLSGVAAGAGILIAYWAARLAESSQSASLGAQQYTILDLRVLAFTVSVALITGFFFGVVPAYLASRLQPVEDLVRTSSGAGSSLAAGRFRTVLIAGQVAMTLVLLAGSLVMGRSFLTLLGTDLGFRTDHVATVSVSLKGSDVAGEGKVTYYRSALEKVRSVPGVVAAGWVSDLPLATRGFSAGTFTLDSGRAISLVAVSDASGDYFRAMRIAFVAGRDFTPQEIAKQEPVVIVNEDFARAAGGIEDLVGRKASSGWFKRTPMTIVGVVRSNRYSGPQFAAPRQIFLPRPWDPMTLAARVHGDPKNYVPLIRDAVRSVDRTVGVFGAKTLDDRLAEALAHPRFYTASVLFFGAFALLLAIVGIYGLTSYSVAQRAHEIGVRIAVGATPSSLRRKTLRQGLMPVMFGMILGLVGAAALGKYLAHLIDAAQKVDAVTCAAAAILLGIVAVVAIWSATQRIVRLDPMRVLRAE